MCFVSSSGYSKMTDQPAAKKPRRGRPPRSENIHKILVRESTFKLWSEKKKAMGPTAIKNIFDR